MGEILDALRDVHRLSSLTIENIVLSEEDTRRIARLNLTRLSLSNNRLSDEAVEPIAGLTRLRHLRLEANKSIRHPKALSQLRALTFLHLERTSFDDEGMALLPPMSKTLEYLFLQATAVSDAGLAKLKGFTALKELHLTTCGKVTGPGLCDLASLPKLEWLELSWCGVKESDLKAITESMKQRNPSLRIQDSSNLPRPTPK